MDRSRYCYILLVQRELLADVMDSSLDFIGSAFKIPGSQCDAVSDLLHLLCAQATGSDGGSTDPDTAGDGRLCGITGDGVLVQGNVVSVATLLQVL